MTSLTPQQSKALAFIADFTREHRYAPSYEEIAKAMGLAAKSGAYRIVRRLSERGAVKLTSRKGRGITLAESHEVLVERERCARMAEHCGFTGLAEEIRRSPMAGAQ